MSEKYILNSTRAIMVLMRGQLRLEPYGSKGCVKPLSPHVFGHPDLKTWGVRVIDKDAYLALYAEKGLLGAQAPKPDAESAPVADEKQEDVVDVEEEAEEEAEEASAPPEDVVWSLEDFKLLEFEDKKQILRDLGLGEHIKLTSNKNVDAGYKTYLDGGFNDVL